MSNKIKTTSLQELITHERLMMWAYASIAPRESLNIYHKCILSELAERFTWDQVEEGGYCPLDQRRVFDLKVSQQGFLRGLLPGIFWAETMRSLWGRVILQHLGITLVINNEKVKPSPMPVFMLPLHCVSCGQKLSNINSDNYSTQQKWKCSEDDSSTYRDCEKTWAVMKATFEKALNVMVTLGTLSFEEKFAVLNESLPVILAAYQLLSRHLNEYDIGTRPYVPRYSLIKEYEMIDYSWFVPYLIFDGQTVTEEIHQPMFTKELIGKTIWAIEDREGRPYFGDAEKVDGEVITITQLKNFLIKKPSPIAITTR